MWADDEYDQPKPAGTGAVRVRVPAKVNLHLGVGEVRPDNYHELQTVYHAISLFDEVTARPGDTLALTMAGEGAGELALDDSNLVLRAARALAEHADVPAHARLHLRKQIPLAGGLAGGSADAAATLVACDALWDLGLSREELAGLAAGLGADVPFLIYGGTALGIGRGEQVSPVLARPGVWHWVVGFHDGGLATPEVYQELDRLRAADAAPAPLPEPAGLLAALRQRDPEVLGAALGNDLAAAARSLRPELSAVLAAGEAAGALAGLISGSGPTCVFLARHAEHAAEVAAALTGAEVCRAVRTCHGPVPGARVQH
ncbi:4-(cytidine 5'-diphospho)-2-C-methyl-D-erythritol kinase [Natronosporangium hydrolyticum]|uniref:4-diphosphocytidyl-2-C-methyl-D-erythritol kinase n=1 Tax=Natronosporangium hydrolyticum TaxID=2811111 RepID=A0A895YSK3_9ACTN|nr:4-(cytidine 5'-diphospho)-2-C-methyl-D-erythritol kinase [Natronosporangium hydrolyticum]QSB17090.1 4-(cytidine 5'-diphospho)-2-C-methyl-D-erythritol kinase [Natronosporangium hydrolyticum]